MTDAFDPKNQSVGHAPKILNRKVYYVGDKIIYQGDSGDRAFYIETGHVDVFVTEGKAKLKVAELGEGDIFGEMALITHEPRTATVVATETSTITLIERSEIEGRVERIKDPAIRALIDVLVERLKNTTQGQFKQYKELADFQDRVTNLVEGVDVNLAPGQRKQFRQDVTPLLDDLQKVLDRYQD